MPALSGRIALLAAAGVLVYANSLDNPFLFDDLGAIVDNRDIRQILPLWRESTESDRPSLNARPLVRLSLAANYAIGQLDPRGYRAANILFHILAGLLLFGLVRQVLTASPTAARPPPFPSQLALACALLWLVHPLHSQCINYVVQRSELLVGLFYFATLYALSRYLAGQGGRWRLLVWAACALGMATKEVMATAPVAAALFDRVFFAGSWRQLWKERRNLYLGMALTWCIPLVLLWSRPHGDSITFTTAISSWTYLLNQCPVVIGYLGKSIWPHPLLLDYGFPEPLTPADVLLSALVLLMLIAAALVLLIRRPPLGFLPAWFFLLLAPTSTIVPIVNEVGAERRIYLALAAVVTLLVLAAAAVLDRLVISNRRRQQASALLLGLVALALSTATWQRNSEHRDPVLLWKTVTTAAPSNPRGHTYLGLALAERGLLLESVHSYQRAVRLKPDYGDAHNNLAMALEAMGQIDTAVDHYRLALRSSPGRAEIHNNFGNLMVNRGDLKMAVGLYQHALELKPAYADAHNNLGIALGLQGRAEEAVEHFREALRLRPGYAEAENNLRLTLKSGSR